jgi:hypothetical protein
MALGAVSSTEKTMASASAVAGILDTREQAQAVFNELKNQGFSAQEISVVLPNRKEEETLREDHAKQRAQGLGTGVVAGAAVAGTLGWIAGLVAFAIPGIGPLLAAGPLVAALADGAIGGAIGAVAGTLLGLRLPDHLEKDYVHALEEGHPIIVAHSDDPARQQIARNVMHSLGANKISNTDETRV